MNYLLFFLGCHNHLGVLKFYIGNPCIWIRFRFHLLTSTNFLLQFHFQWKSSTSEGNGWGRLWKAVEGCGRLWKAAEGCGRLGPWAPLPLMNKQLPRRSRVSTWKTSKAVKSLSNQQETGKRKLDNEVLMVIMCICVSTFVLTYNH